MSSKRRSRAAATDHPPPPPLRVIIDNDDLLTQILVLLPAKYLMRFKSVCKRWLSLISSDHFCHQHTLRHPKLQPSIIIQMQSKQLFYLNQTTNDKKAMIPYRISLLDSHQIVQACNGLMLLTSNHRKHDYYVYNPTTRRLRKIILTKRGDSPEVKAIILAFEPSKSPYYKVVCLRARSDPVDHCTYQFEVYDSESHTWRLRLEGHAFTKIDYDSGLYWNNHIFWNIPVDCSFCYDIAKNEVTRANFNKAPNFSYTNTRKFLQESNGHLYSFVMLEHAPNLQGSVWGVKKDFDHPKWIKKYIGATHPHPVIDASGARLMLRSNGDGSTCSLLAYEAEHRRIMVYNYFGEGSELLVDLTRQPVSEFDRPVKAFEFGEILALV